MKVKSQSEVAQLCPTLSNPMDCSPPGSSVHGIFQARVLEWGAIFFLKRRHCFQCPSGPRLGKSGQVEHTVSAQLGGGRGGEVGQADPKGGKSPEMWLPEDGPQDHVRGGG